MFIYSRNSCRVHCFRSFTSDFGSLLVVLALVNISDLGMKENCFSQNRALDRMPWRILHDDLRLLDDNQAKSLVWMKEIFLSTEYF